MNTPLAETDEKSIAASAVNSLVKETGIPMVIDADAINALADSPGLLKERRSPTILTPHPVEMGRLTGKSTAEVQKDRIGVARGFAMEHGVYIVLKGAHTVIAEPSGAVHISATGNPGMATGGTGDALTGIIAGLIAQGLETAQAAKLGVYLHGLAGDLAAA